MSNLKRQSCIFTFGAFFFLNAVSAFAVVSEVVVSQAGQPLANATVSLELGDGTQVAEAKTDQTGLASVEVPAAAESQTVTAKVKKSDEDDDDNYKVAALPLMFPAGESWYRFAADTAGGLVGYTRSEFNVLKKSQEPITVGPNGEVGSGARMKEKVKETVGGFLGGAVGGFLGNIGGSGIGVAPGGDDSGSQEPQVTADPIPKDKKRVFTDPATGTQIAVGTMLTPAGLLVSASIVKSPDDGTFQAVYLQDPEGKQAGPVQYYIYELYQDWKLVVSWTFDRWENGNHVEHREGGWDESGQVFLGTYKVPGEGDGIWKRSGFNNAAQGIRALGTLFPISAAVLQQTVMNLIIHITRPSQDVVTTIPFVMSMPPTAWQSGAGQLVRPF